MKIIFPNHTAEIITYDELGRIDVIETVKIDSDTGETLEVLASFDYEVDDVGNRLIGVEIVEGSETTTIEYEYNENGIRVGQTVDGVETSYLIDELRPYAQVLEEYDAQGNPISTYTYGLDFTLEN